jgi:hypothetical protein
MRAKQILWCLLILTMASMAVACQPVSGLSASAVSSIAMPLPQAVQYSSGVYLTATTGPTCVRVVWSDPPCVQAYAGEFVVTELNGAEVTRVMTNYQGQATIILPPGKYIVGVRTENADAWTAPVVVNVLPDRYSFISFTVNAGLQWQSVGMR